MEKGDNNKRITVSVEKAFRVSAAVVFEAFLDTDKLSRWMFGAEVREEKIISLSLDAKEGGRFSFVVQRGEDVINHLGRYLTIAPPDKLVFTWNVDVDAGSESVVSIDIKATGEGCLLTLVHEMDVKWSEYADRTKQGWAYMLDKLQQLVHAAK